MANKIWLSVVIPSYKDPILHKTIDSLLENSKLGDKLEVIPVLDGYWPEKAIKEDPRVKVVHIGKNGGMRNSINNGVRVARGRYIMRTDEHCMFAPGYDRTLVTQIRHNWIVTLRRFFLDPKKWEVMDLLPVDYEKLAIRRDENGKPYKFEGQKWPYRTKKHKDIMVDESMAMQGSCWIMKKRWWEEVIGELQTEGYGPLIQDSHEMVFKTWKAGGKLMVNKNTWFAHKHVKFPRLHNQGTKETPANCDEGYKYALKVWKEYYLKEIAPKWGISV